MKSAIETVDFDVVRRARAIHRTGVPGIAVQLTLSDEIAAAREKCIDELEEELAKLRNHAQSLTSKVDLQKRHIATLGALLESDSSKRLAFLESRKDWQRAVAEPSEAIVPLAIADAAGRKHGAEISFDQAMTDGEMWSLAAFFERVLSGQEIRFFEREIEPSLYHDPHIDK